MITLIISFCCSVTQPRSTLCDPMDCMDCQASLSITNSRSLLKLMSIESVMPSSHLILCHSLLLPPSILLSIRVFSNESVLIRWPKYWSFSFNVSPSNEYSGLISFRIDWLDLLAVQFSSVAQSCPTLYDPMDSSMPGFPIHHQLLELAQTHVLWVGDAIQPSHPWLSPSPPAFNLSQHQGLFQWVSSSHQVVKALEFQLQHQSFQWIFRTDFL